MAIREASFLGHHSTLPAGGSVPWVCQESGPPEPPKPRPLDRVRHAIETRHYSRGTEKACATPPRWVPALTITPPERTRYPGGAPYIIALGLGGVLHGRGS